MSDDKRYVLKKFGDLVEGDVVPGPDGDVTITKAYPKHIPEEMFELELDDGRSIKAGGTHLWYIETQTDQAYHSLRLKKARKILRRLPKQMVELLEELASYSQTDVSVESPFNELSTLLGATSNSDLSYVIARVLESLGPIVEENIETHDLLTDDVVDETTIPMYNATIAAKQLLSLGRFKKWHKKESVIVGRIVSTRELFDMMEESSIDIPVLESK